MADLYIHTHLADATALGDPGPVPAHLVGLSDAQLADLDAFSDPPPPGLGGTGFWPLVVAPASYDPALKMPTGGTTAPVADAAGKRWTATQAVRDMTADEVRAAYLAAHPVPASVSDRQFFQQLALQNDITQDEAIAYVTVGALPKIISDGIAQLPTAQQFGARMAICGANSFERSNALVPVLGAILNKTPDQLDAIWRAAALL